MRSRRSGFTDDELPPAAPAAAIRVLSALLDLVVRLQAEVRRLNVARDDGLAVGAAEEVPVLGTGRFSRPVLEQQIIVVVIVHGSSRGLGRCRGFGRRAGRSRAG